MDEADMGSVDDVTMLDFEPESAPRPRRRSRPKDEEDRVEVRRPYSYKGVRGGPLIAGYVK